MKKQLALTFGVFAFALLLNSCEMLGNPEGISPITEGNAIEKEVLKDVKGSNPIPDANALIRNYPHGDEEEKPKP